MCTFSIRKLFKIFKCDLYAGYKIKNKNTKKLRKGKYDKN